MGESLGNDGTSLMLFELFLMLVLSNNQVAGSEIVTLVARSLLLSPLLGMATGFLTYLWLRSLKRTTKETDILIQIGITLCSCYLTFYVSQYTFQARYIIIYHHHYYYPHYHRYYHHCYHHYYHIHCHHYNHYYTIIDKLIAMSDLRSVPLMMMKMILI